MIVTLHGLSTAHHNMRSDIRLAREAGYEALEMTEAKLLRYLDCGQRAEDLVTLFQKHDIRPVCINALKGVEVQALQARAQLIADARRLCQAAETMGCPVIQLVPLCALENMPWEEGFRLTVQNVAEIADIGREHGIKFQMEPVAWAPINSLSKSLRLIQETGRDNLGMVIDFWHLWAGEETTPDEVAQLDGSQIFGVHFCDGLRHQKGTEWVEGNLRGFLPGDGKIPIKEWVAAVKATGFDGVWSSELYSPKHWEWDLMEIALEARARMEQFAGWGLASRNVRGKIKDLGAV